MAKKRLNQDEAFKSLMKIEDNKADEAILQDENNITTPLSNKENKEKTTPTSFYITDKHRKALKMKIALSDKPEDKDYSSIVRTALDIYLADILKDIK